MPAFPPSLAFGGRVGLGQLTQATFVTNMPEFFTPGDRRDRMTEAM